MITKLKKAINRCFNIKSEYNIAKKSCRKIFYRLVSPICILISPFLKLLSLIMINKTRLCRALRTTDISRVDDATQSIIITSSSKHHHIIIIIIKAWQLLPIPRNYRSSDQTSNVSTVIDI